MNSSRIALVAAVAAAASWTLKAVAIGTAGGLDKSPLEGPLFFAGCSCFVVASVALGVAITRGAPVGCGPWPGSVGGRRHQRRLHHRRGRQRRGNAQPGAPLGLDRAQPVGDRRRRPRPQPRGPGPRRVRGRPDRGPPDPADARAACPPGRRRVGALSRTGRMARWRSPSSWSRWPWWCWPARRSPERIGVPPPLLLVVVGVAGSFLPVHARHRARARGRAVRPAAAAAVRRRAADLAGRLQRQPAADPAALGRAGRLHRLRGRRGRRTRCCRTWAGRCRSRSARSSPRPTRWRRRRSAAGSGCRAGSSRSWRASRCSTTRPPWSRCAPRSRSAASAWRPSACWRSAPTCCWRPSAAPRSGFAAFLLVAKVRRHVTDPMLDTGISLVVPFASYVAGRGDPRLGRHRRGGGGPAARAQGAGPADGPVADRRADELAHHRASSSRTPSSC